MPTRDRLSGADPGVGATLRDVVLVGTHENRAGRDRVELELDELEELARTLETTVLDRTLLPLREPHPATYLRSGAVEALGTRLAELGNPAVLFNDQLTPRQQRNLEETWEVPVLDRTEVILAIFAQRATSAEGRVQVEMAQLDHQLPRLAGGWTHLERQRGGVGMRGGAGEKQIEVDRRIIGQKLKRLRKRLVEIQRQRGTRRQARTDVPLASCALVGYTNAGKSTLLNTLTHSHVLADNLLFATLDPTSRLITFASGRRVILVDTVGFIQALPTELVEAFAATLEEVRQANLLAVVVDASHPEADSQLRTVLETLQGMECGQPALLVLSKIDRVDPAALDGISERLAAIAGADPVLVSALQGTGLRDLRAAIDRLAAEVVPDTRANRADFSAPGAAPPEDGFDRLVHDAHGLQADARADHNRAAGSHARAG